MALPKSIRVAAKPGETINKTYTLDRVPHQITLITRIVGGDSLIRVTEVVANKSVHVPSPYSNPWGDGPPTGGDGSNTSGYDVLQVVGEAQEGQPLVVEAGANVVINVRFTPTNSSQSSVHSAKLIVGSIEIPIVFVVGTISVEVLGTPVEVTIGQTTSLAVRVGISGPPDTEISLNCDGDRIVIPRQILRIPSGGTATANLTLYGRPNYDPGQYTEQLWVTGFSDTGFEVPFEVRLKRPIPPESYADRLEKAKAAIQKHYFDNGAQKSFGFAIKDFEVREGVPMQQFARGPIKFLNGTVLGPGAPNYVSLRFVGFKCLKESTEASASDEPYFLISAAGTGGSVTRRYGPYENVDAGEIRVINDPFADMPQKLWPPVILTVKGMEHDEGTPEEAEEKVRKVVQDLVNTITAVAGGVAGADVSSHIMPDWARTIIIGWVPEIAAKLFGMGDDEIGFNANTLWDYNPNATEWKGYRELGRLDQVPYNMTLKIPPGSADSEGQHELYFDVQLVKDGRVVAP